VLTSRGGGFDVVDEGGADARKAIRGVGDAEATAADHDAAGHLAVRHGPCCGGGELRVVHRIGAVRAEVAHLVARGLELPAERLFQGEAPVVTGQNDRITHVDSSSVEERSGVRA
jgi:hypothetical protein